MRRCSTLCRVHDCARVMRCFQPPEEAADHSQPARPPPIRRPPWPMASELAPMAFTQSSHRPDVAVASVTWKRPRPFHSRVGSHAKTIADSHVAVCKSKTVGRCTGRAQSSTRPIKMAGSSAQLLKVALCNQPLDVALADKKLAVLRQGYGSGLRARSAWRRNSWRGGTLTHTPFGSPRRP